MVAVDVGTEVLQEDLRRAEGRLDADAPLAVFDQQAASWRGLGRSAPQPRPGWTPLDLGRSWNVFYADVAGLPIGLADLAGVPFRFAPIGSTHAELSPGATLRLTLPAVPIRDLHLLATQPRDGDRPRPGARLRLLHQGRVVHEEELLSIRHLCDWWAPLGRAPVGRRRPRLRRSAARTIRRVSESALRPHLHPPLPLAAPASALPRARP